MYKALLPISQFKAGDLIPDEIGEQFSKLTYLLPHVEKIEDKQVKIVEAPEEIKVKEEPVEKPVVVNSKKRK